MNGYWDVKQTHFPGMYWELSLLHTTSLILATSEGEKFFEGKWSGPGNPRISGIPTLFKGI